MNKCSINEPELEITPMVAQLSLSFDNDDNVLNSIRAIEKAYWDYIDNYKFNQYYKFKNFLEIIIAKYKPSLIDNVPYFIRQYNKYKKSLATDGIIFYTRDAGLKFIVVKINGSKIWSMPKGKREQGESSLNCAIREFREETGIDIQEFSNNMEKINLIKTNFFILESDYAFRLNKYKTNEITNIKWANVSEILNTKDIYSKQTLQVALYLLNSNSNSLILNHID